MYLYLELDYLCRCYYFCKTAAADANANVKHIHVTGKNTYQQYLTTIGHFLSDSIKYEEKAFQDMYNQ